MGGGHLLNKAFTLIELLAVIIILAIIALIATPIILDVINGVRISAGKSEANMILSGINNYCATEYLKEQLDSNYVKICTSSMNEETVKEMVRLGNAQIKDVSFDGNKLAILVIESNNHKYTLCSNGKFAVDDEECQAIKTGPIKEVLLSNYPYLETKGDGCITQTSYNYSYMGGCYLKGSLEDGKKEFYQGFLTMDMSESMIKIAFFDENVNFISEKFEKYMLRLFMDNFGVTEEEIKQMLKEQGVETFFELYFQAKVDEVVNNMNGKTLFYQALAQMGIEDETIINNFFDDSGNFKQEEYETWYRDYAKSKGATDEELEQALQQANVETFFELTILTSFNISMTPDELFSLDGNKYILIYLSKMGVSISKEVIDETFFDNNGTFKIDVYENFAREDLYKKNYTDEMINQMLQEKGVSTLFEYKYSMTPESLFAKKALNNSIWYSGFLWRIMGINADGTIKLITDENVTAIPYGASYTGLNWDGSYAKDWLNNYFYPKLKGNEIIVEHSWCSETTTNGNSVRTSCTNNLSTQASKVGLITIDEYNLAGGGNSYLHISQYFRTMTPYDQTKAWVVSSRGDLPPLDNMKSGNSNGLRPVVNIKSDTVITGGDGNLLEDWNNEIGPYILNEDKKNNSSGKLSDLVTIGEYVEFSGKKYRVVGVDSNGNTKLILDSFYKENNEEFKTTFGSSNDFNPLLEGNIGHKLNVDVLNWLTNNSSTEQEKLQTITWYQNNFNDGNNYKNSLENTNNPVDAKVGLISVGDILASHSSSILTSGYKSDSIGGNWYWMMNVNGNSSIWRVSGAGSASTSRYSSKYFIRPVIVIKSDINIITGNGTWSNPYQI